MEQTKSKASLIREHLPELKAMREKGDTLGKIRKHLEAKLGMHLSVGSFYRIIKEDNTVKGDEEVIRLSPEKLELLNDTGVIHIVHEGKSYRIESKKWCCKKLEKYGRSRGKIVAKFNSCPFCGTKR